VKVYSKSFDALKIGDLDSIFELVELAFWDKFTKSGRKQVWKEV